MTNISLLSECAGGGCGAKVGPGELAGLLSGLSRVDDPNLLVGFDNADDAAVYDLGGVCVISTADFFSPIVDDPYIFGKIAAANALSDVYAMGGRPVMALNLVCFPQKAPMDVLSEILRGGAEKLAEAGAALAGGHSIYDREIKYGLSVTGVCEKSAMLRNNTPRVGDRLILTKPLGTGLVMAALRAGEAKEADVSEAVASMERLNKYAAGKLTGFDIGACTDVTGFGLAGHGLEMASGGVTLLIDAGALPVLSGALGYAGEYLLTAAGQRNREFAGDRVSVEALGADLQELVFDPQTSGGLLIAVRPGQADELLKQIQAGCPRARIIGSVAERGGHAVIFQ